MHCVLLKYHPMIGLDFHDEITATVPPLPEPNTPHLCGHVLYGWGLGTVTPANIKANGMQIVMRGSDISNGIIHVPLPPWPPICLIALVIGFSGSKSHFGPRAVQSGGKPIAAAILILYNLNLNCNSIAPFPTGLVIAPSTVLCGMTLGDILGGAFAMITDIAFGYLLNKITGGIGGWLAGDAIGKIAQKVFADTVSAVLQTLFGSPLGWSPDGAPVGTLSGMASDGNRWLGEKLGDWLSPPQQYGPHGEPLAPGATASPPASPSATAAPDAALGAPSGSDPGATRGTAPGASGAGSGAGGSAPRSGGAAPSGSTHPLDQPAQPPPLPPDHPAAGVFDDPSVEQFA